MLPILHRLQDHQHRPTNDHARAAATGLTLVRVNNGVKTTDISITFAGNVTLTALAAAANALGWSAKVTGDATNYGSWPQRRRFLAARLPDLRRLLAAGT
jgi:hypothetical protein